MEIFKIFGSVFLKSDEADKSLDRLDKKGKNTASGFDNMTKKVTNFGKNVLMAGGLAVGGLTAIAANTLGTADSLVKLSDQTGIGIERLQELQYAAKQQGVEFDVVSKSVNTLGKLMGTASDGNKAAIETFKDMGVSMDDLKKKTPAQMFDDLLMKLADMPEGSEKTQLGNKLLGKSYLELKPMLNGGSKQLAELTKKAREVGVNSEESVKAVDDFGDSIESLKSGIAAKAMEILGKTINFVKQNLDWILPVLGSFLFTITGLMIISKVNALLTAWHKATTTMTLAQWLLNTAMSANPIGLLVIGIGLVIAAVWTMWNKFEWFRDGITGIFKGIGDTIKGVFIMAINFVIDAINQMIGAYNVVNVGMADMDAVRKIGQSDKDYAQTQANVGNAYKLSSNKFDSKGNTIYDSKDKVNKLFPSATSTKLYKFATGGIVYDKINATVGEYPEAKNDPEVISPLSKLKKILNPQPSVVINIDGAIFMDDYGVDKFMDRVQSRMRDKVGF